MINNFITDSGKKYASFEANYPPLLVDVVIERPLGGGGDDVVLQKCYRVTVRVLPWHSIASHKELRRQSVAGGAPARRQATATHVERRLRGGDEAAAAADTEANKKLFLFDL